MVNQPDQDTQGVHTPARKLVLPEPPNAGQDRRPYSSPRSGQFINQSTSTAFHGLFTRVLGRWRTDPAFAMLSLAIALVVIASFVFVSLGVRAIATSSSTPVWNKAMTEHPVVPTPAGTFDIKPKFPTPVSGKGSSTSSQPGTGPSTYAQPTPNDQGTLNVQIVNIPNVVNNQSRVRVDIQTSEPNVDVQLQVTYDSAPFTYTSNGDTTDDQGNATLNWNVRVRSFANGNNVQASVIVVATDQNGQQATSQPMTVEVTQ
jgi:hypothetical protein